MSKKHFFWGTFILTCTGLFSRLIGFFYRIFLSCSIGAQGLGIFQLTLPLQTLIMTISTSGIQTAISRLTASCLAVKSKEHAHLRFFLGTSFALLLSLLSSVFLYTKADFFAVQILKEARTLPLLQILSFSFPLGTLHTCINSYYFGRKKTLLPSAIQLSEQIIRFGSTYLIYCIFLSEGKEITPVIAAGGALSSEFAAALASLLAITFHFHNCPKPLFSFSDTAAATKELFHMSLPLTLNRILLSLLSGIEMILIPQMLCVFGLNKESALTIYGIFTGMVIPFILFPSAITNSASVLLTPSVAEFQALGKSSRIPYVIKKTIQCCLFLGSVCCFTFFFFGKPIGIFLFKNLTAGTYIRTMAFICPFLYLNTALSSILNGLGKPGTCLFHNIVGIGIRLTAVIFAVPRLGIKGYLYGILLSELTHSLLHLFSFSYIIQKITGFSYRQ